MGAWQVSQCYQRKPGKDLSDSITIDPIIKTIAPPVAIFNISLQIFYRWKWRYDPDHLESLENSSCRPEKVGQPTCSTELVVAVQKVRKEYPGWDKDKLAVLLHRQGFSCSVSTVGRIINCLKACCILNEPARNHISAHRRRIQRPTPWESQRITWLVSQET